MDKTLGSTEHSVPSSLLCLEKKEMRKNIHDRTSFRACTFLQGLGCLSAPSSQGSCPAFT